jgi:3-phosphoshikimate 1-carboxyvinyltransferase
MNISLEVKQLKKNQTICISGSKSETNRLLLLQALYPDLTIKNISDSDDSLVMKQCLQSRSLLKNVHHAGTAMRFLTAYFALCTQEKVVLTGSERMQQRPIHTLVDALQQLGAEVTYLNQQGFPPLQINGKKLQGGKVILQADISSQFITALLLAGSKLPDGLEVELIGKVTSRPYIEMTLRLLSQIGIETLFTDNKISVFPVKTTINSEVTVESDWSSASYFYSIIALSPQGTSVTLKYYRQNSLQGDAVVAAIYKEFGVNTTFENNQVILEKVEEPEHRELTLNLNDTPDLAQTISVTCLGLNLSCKLLGLHTLKIKETDRLKALYIELTKLGGNVEVTEDTLTLSKHSRIRKNIRIDTYDDHRMAMAFAPLALKVNLRINNAEVVSKSFVSFWECIQKMGFDLKAIK